MNYSAATSSGRNRSKDADESLVRYNLLDNSPLTETLSPSVLLYARYGIYYWYYWYFISNIPITLPPIMVLPLKLCNAVCGRKLE